MTRSPEEEIRRALAQYALLHGREDIDRLVLLFTEDGRVIARGAVHTGRDAVKALFADELASLPPDTRTKHGYVNAVIHVHDDAAAVTSDMVAYAASGYGPWTISFVGQCEDRLVRRDGRWLFVERIIHPS